MHIPKTGGTSVNTFFQNHYPGRKSATHIENQVIQKPEKDWLKLRKYDFISGHLKISTLKRVVDANQYFSVTLLRAPLKQLLSHMTWIYRLGFPENQVQLSQHPDYVKKFVERMHTLDIVEYLETMSPLERNYFDNCQTRYLLPFQGDVMLEEQHLDRAVLTLMKFDFVGLVERFQETLNLISYMLNWSLPKESPKKNVTEEKYKLDLNLEDDSIREKIDDLLFYDRYIYRIAAARFNLQLRNVMVRNQDKFHNLDADWFDKPVTERQFNKLF